MRQIFRGDIEHSARQSASLGERGIIWCSKAVFFIEVAEPLTCRAHLCIDLASSAIASVSGAETYTVIRHCVRWSVQHLTAGEAVAVLGA